MSRRQISEKLKSISNDLHVNLDDSRMQAFINEETKIWNVHVTVKTSLSSPESTRLVQTSVHSALLDLFGLESHINVYVQNYSNQEMKNFPNTIQNVQEWITKSAMSVDDFMLQAIRTTAHSAYERIVRAYPWRDEKSMLAKIPYLVYLHTESFKSGQYMPLACCDDILRPLNTILKDQDEQTLLAEVPHRNTLLDVYEHIYATVVVNNKHSRAFRVVFDALFGDNLWEEWKPHWSCSL